MNTYGTLTSVTNNTKEVFTTTTSNGTSNTTLSGQIVVIVTCDWTDRGSYTPALNSAYPSDSTYLATSVERKQLTASLCEITTTYTSTATSLPATTYNEQSSQIEVDIREHPSFSDWEDDWDDENNQFLLTSDKAGIKSYIKGSTTVTVTIYSDSKPTDDRSTIGTIQTPGLDYGDGGNWLLVGSNRSLQGIVWVKSQTYLFSAKPWNSDIYSAS